MADVDITSLSVEISAESQGAELNIDKLATAISNLRTKGNVAKVIDGLDKLTNSLTALKSAQGDFSGLEKVTQFIEGISKVNASESAKSINTLARSIQKIPDSLSGMGSLTDSLDSLLDVAAAFDGMATIQAPKGLNSAINAVKKIPDALNGTDSVNSDLAQTKSVLESFNELPAVKTPDGLTGFVSTLRRIPGIVSSVNGSDFTSLGESMRKLMNALAPLSVLDFSNLKNLGSVFNALGKIPDLTGKLDSKTLDDFSTACQKITTSLIPLASQLDKVGNAFAKLPPQLSKVVTQANRVTAANEKQRKSYLSLSNQMNGFMRNMAKLVSLKAIAEYLGNAVAKFNDFYEATDLFHNAMGNLSGEADTLISKMQGLLGVDLKQSMEQIATIQSLATSFGLASDKAYILSTNLTQLAHDEASYWNKSATETFTAMSSAIAGEIEPIRRLGVDLSQARLQQELLTLGFSKQVSSLSQADKAVLRYIAIMKQTTNIQGNLAQTINSPANQIKILKAQLDMLAKSVGSLLYPALKSILPPLIAAVQLIREFVEWVAKLMGVKVVFTDFTKSADSVGGIGDAMDDTADSTKKAAKALKDYTMGFDELNIIDPTQGSSSSGSGASGGNLLGGVDLSSYDMFSKYDEGFGKQIDNIKQKIKDMLPVIGAVTAALALWKLTGFISDIIEAIKKIGILKGLVAGGILIGIGFYLMFDGIKKAIKDKLNAINFAEILVGAISLVGGAALLGAKIAQFITTSFADSAVAQAITAAGGQMGGALIGAAVAGVVAGLAMFVTGVYDALHNGLNTLNGLLIPLGSTMAGAGIGAIIGSLGGPIGAGIGALIGLAVGALTDLGIAIAQNWDTIKSTILSKWNDLKNWWSGTALPAIQTVPSKVGDVISSIANWFSGLPEKIGYALGFAVGKIGEWVGNMVVTVTTEVPKIISSVVKFFEELPGKIWTAILKALDTITKWREQMISFVVVEVPKIVLSIVSEFKKLSDELRKLGKFIWDGLINGLKDAWSTVTNGIKGFTDGFINGFKDALGIHSPSTVFAEIGGFLMQGLVQGVENAKDYVNTAFNVMGAQAVNAAATGLGLDTGKFNTMGQEAGIDTAAGLNAQVPTVAGFFNSAATYFGTNFRVGLDDTWAKIDNAIKTDTIGSIQTLFTAIKNGDLSSIAKWSASYFYAHLSAEQKTQIQTFAQNALAQLSGSLSGVFQNLSGLAQGFIGMFVPSVTAATTSQVGLNIAMDANPIMLIISLIGMLAGALINFSGTNQDVGNSFKKVWINVKILFSYVVEEIAKLSVIPLQALVSMVNGIIKVYNKIAKWVPGISQKSLITTPYDYIEGKFDKDRAKWKQELSDLDKKQDLGSADNTDYDSKYQELLKEQEERANELKKQFENSTPGLDNSSTNSAYKQQIEALQKQLEDLRNKMGQTATGSLPSWNPSNYPGTKEWDKDNNWSSGTVSGGTTTVKIDETEMRESVYNGTYNAFLDIFQRYGDELTGGKELKIYLNGKQITASVEKTQSARGRSLMGSEIYGY